MSGEISTLIASGEMSAQASEWYSPAEPRPVDVLNMVQQTINIISQDLVLGGAFAWGDLPMDKGPNDGNIIPTAADIETTAYGGTQDAAMYKFDFWSAIC
ncbi:hypothetical protein EDB83DRAFT_2525130 [Lactarius deliciosus]|nr:hypothetical protein EDB83DRAFT_2525130 [Lactarius deliciosus]